MIIKSSREDGRVLILSRLLRVNPNPNPCLLIVLSCSFCYAYSIFSSLVVGTALLKGLGELRDEFASVGDVRGKGLMIGVEMVTDKESKTPLPPDQVN